MIKKDKKCIGPVVATVLLIVIAVVAIVGFSTWFNSYKDNVLTNVEVQSKEAMENNLNIENVISNTLYIKNGIADNLTLSSIKIGNEICNTSVNLTLGMNEIDVSSCLSNLTGSVQDVVLISPKRIVAKTLYINSLAGGGGSCSVIDADNDGLVDWLDDNDASPNSVCSADNSGYCFINESTKSALDTDLTASNIKTSTTIFGTTGTLPIDSDGDGLLAWKDTNDADATGGNGLANLVAGNVKSGTTINGVTGTLTSAPSGVYVRITSSTYTAAQAQSDTVCSGEFGTGWRIFHKGCDSFTWLQLSSSQMTSTDELFVQNCGGGIYDSYGDQVYCVMNTDGYSSNDVSCFDSDNNHGDATSKKALCISS